MFSCNRSIILWYKQETLYILAQKIAGINVLVISPIIFSINLYVCLDNGSITSNTLYMMFHILYSKYWLDLIWSIYLEVVNVM